MEVKIRVEFEFGVGVDVGLETEVEVDVRVGLDTGIEVDSSIEVSEVKTDIEVDLGMMTNPSYEERVIRSKVISKLSFM